MKSGSWIEERRSVLLVELVHQMFLAKLFFEELCRRHQEAGCVPFKDLNAWVGSEMSKGSLWNLKDTSHLLFRDHGTRSFCEGLFDWTLGSIFHEGMKLKEDVYLMEFYHREGTVSSGEGGFANGSDLRELEEEFKLIITRARESAYAEMVNLRYLFSRAMAQLQRILERYHHDALLVRYLVTHEELYDQVYGEGACNTFFAKVYQGGTEEAYVRAGEHFREAGWLSEALEIVQKALGRNPRNAEAKKEMREIRKALEKQS